MSAKTLTRWTAETDYRDATVKGGYGRTELAVRVSRDEADAALYAAVEAHLNETDHVVVVSQSYPGKTFVSCSCKQAFAATAVR